MSIEQIDEKLKCIMIQINDVANELYQSDQQRCSRLKVAALNIGCVRADIERAAELVDGQKPTTNSAIMQLLGRFLTLEAKWMDYAGPVAVFHELCAEARKLGATAQ